MGADVPEAVKSALDHADPARRAAAARATGVLGTGKIPEAVNLLITALKDDSPLVQAGAAGGLARIGPDAAPASHLLADLLADHANDMSVRQTAAVALGKIGQADSKTLQALFTSLLDPFVAGPAAGSIAEIKAASGLSAEELQKLSQRAGWEDFLDLQWVRACLLLLCSVLVYLIARGLLVTVFRAFASKSAASWDDYLVKHKVFYRLSHLAPALVIHSGIGLAIPDDPWLSGIIQRLAMAWMVLAGTLVANAFIDAITAMLQSYKGTKDKPIRSYTQVVKILLWLAGTILLLATLMNRSPWAFLSGLGALTAVLMLVFKDSILGLVASIQIATLDLVRRGDWIEMPKFGTDGEVIDISLSTIKVQNWDKTISTIPTYALISDSFKNWRGMSESGGRRIRRSLSLDMGSIRFCDGDLLEKLRKVNLLKDYLAGKEQEIAEWNKEHDAENGSQVNGRHLTNIGTYRAYIEAYLRAHPEIHQEGMTFLVRQLSPDSQGLPIEIYVFSKEQRWAFYEAMIGDIFDHLLAVLPEFELRIYQRPTGADLQGLARA